MHNMLTVSKDILVGAVLEAVEDFKYTLAWTASREQDLKVSGGLFR